jgi:8-oxo-dGTP pyrophosphatase MutT (NUDIX family)
MLDTGQQMFALIQAYFSQFPEEKASLLPRCAFIAEAKDPFIRSNLPGHITGSGFVMRGDEMLLIHHRYIKEWFQPGGHVDPGENPRQSALREIEEETGWLTKAIATNPNPLVPFDIDAHLIPANPLKNEPEHWHIDFAYLLEPLEQRAASDQEEQQWFQMRDLDAPRLARVIKKYQGLRHSGPN